jgi:LmbE family N-acetylglucosaminyl deacetylase
VNVLAVVAHPDDEILGVGGTLARHAAQGDRVSVVILGEGMSSRKLRYEAPAESAILTSRDETREALAVLGVDDVRRFELPDQRFDSLPLLDIVKVVAAEVERVAPAVVYTHFRNDINVDHQRTFQAVLVATRPVPACPVEWVFAFETLSATEWNYHADTGFAPNFYVDIAGQLEHKLAAMAKYSSELKTFPHPRSLAAIEHSARLRGAHCGYLAAEAFVMVRGSWGHGTFERGNRS